MALTDDKTNKILDVSSADGDRVWLDEAGECPCGQFSTKNLYPVNYPKNSVAGGVNHKITGNYHKVA